MKPFAALLLAALALAGCGDRNAGDAPKPASLTAQAIGRYCGMNILEHPGPKGQILLRGNPEPIWFSSARDALAFTMLPEEPKDIAAIYVSDMGRAPSWDAPGADNWVEARKAWFVVGGSARGGMGVAELVPFGEKAAAERFAAEKGGTVMAFDEVPPSAALAAEPASGEEPPSREPN